MSYKSNFLTGEFASCASRIFDDGSPSVRISGIGAIGGVALEQANAPSTSTPSSSLTFSNGMG